ncbi:MAG: FAD-linked oxidase C-terminal domain-containing protein, partial [Woeseiaceae bacterium]|nr:FAD-linked oxidase C-terminal domain-containing protein [Woeseiaceae bacterium]
GCLHVRPVLDMRTASGAQKMRAIAEEACQMVREYKGSYSGEHGDGLVRSEWIERMYGPRLAGAFAEIKRAFDPVGLMNPGKIVDPVRMDDRALFRFKPGYRTFPIRTGLDWSQHEIGEKNRGRGFAAAVEMCNNNGHCRKFDAGTMCPSYRATRNERDLTRGRANSLRLALSGQLGPDALTSRDMYETMALCVSCKGCKRECPTGVDMAAMKIEFLHQYHRKHRRPLKDQLIAKLPRYAPVLAKFPGVLNLRNEHVALAWLGEKLFGLSARRRLPDWRRDPFLGQTEVPGSASGPEVVLLADTFNTWFEPENLRAAVRVLTAANYRVVCAAPAGGGRPLCCGRTFLASGMLDEARTEAKRLLQALGPYLDRGIPIVGLEPSCILGLRDELPLLVPGPGSKDLGELAMTFEEFLVRERSEGRLQLALGKVHNRRAMLHGHCHQKAFGVMPAVVEALQMVPQLEVETVTSSCCGMAGSFGYDADYVDVSLQMAEASLLPTVRDTDEDTVIVADGTSCRHQINELTDKTSRHAACVLADSLANGRAS